MGDQHGPIEQRFWKRVAKADSDECWLWTGATSVRKTGAEYGQLRGSDGYAHKLAHRVALEISGVELTSQDVVHHVCRNTLCVNPAHLQVTTRREHMGLHKRVWEREEILQAIRDFVSAYGVLPAASDWNSSMARRLGHHQRVLRYEQNDWPASSTVVYIFGSWAEAIQAAGFPRPRRGRRKRSEEMQTEMTYG